MTRTRAASLHTGVRSSMAFHIHDYAAKFAPQSHTLTAHTLPLMNGAGERIAAEVQRRGAGWDSVVRRTGFGRILAPTDALRLRQEVAALEGQLYGSQVSLQDLARYAPALVGLLSRLADELDSWLSFWDSYRAEDPAGFAQDCPEPAAACAPVLRADDLEPLPPTDRAQQLTAAPCAPPAGIAAS